ncbi:hypothetical protein NQZ68_030179 [Dissostichus eleginoides]|nr:hypothetical protein NQZ68_030179 [Dissostichus eleginoides]
MDKAFLTGRIEAPHTTHGFSPGRLWLAHHTLQQRTTLQQNDNINKKLVLSSRFICRGLLCFLRDIVALPYDGRRSGRAALRFFGLLPLLFPAVYCCDAALRMTRLHFDILCHGS